MQTSNGFPLTFNKLHTTSLPINSWLAHVPGLIFYKNTDLIYTAASNYAARLCGFKDVDQFCGNNDFELRCAASESALQFRDEDKKVITSAQEIACLQVHLFADNKVHIFLLRKAPIVNSLGVVEGVCSFGNEVADPTVGQAIFKLLSLGKADYNTRDLKNINFEINANKDFNKLSSRESELIFYFMRGFTTKELGKLLNLSPRTIESYLETIKRKFKCSSKNELLHYCMDHGFSYIIPQVLLQKCLQKSVSWLG